MDSGRLIPPPEPLPVLMPSISDVFWTDERRWNTNAQIIIRCFVVVLTASIEHTADWSVCQQQESRRSRAQLLLGMFVITGNRVSLQANSSFHKLLSVLSWRMDGCLCVWLLSVPLCEGQIKKNVCASAPTFRLRLINQPLKRGKGGKVCYFVCEWRWVGGCRAVSLAVSSQQTGDAECAANDPWGKWDWDLTQN